MCVSEFCFILLFFSIILLNIFGFVRVVCCVVKWLLWCVVYELKFFFGKFILWRYLFVVLLVKIVFEGDK